jgi:GTP diphosphokinase / guanosine-3',5'-bis(diphosphate) 3'-diphosphatase
MNAQADTLQLVIQALAFAAGKHRDQRRKDAEASPYINHPIALASVLCCEAGIVDTTAICAAILHDTIEDTNTTRRELEHHFGIEIAQIVTEVSDDTALSRTQRKQGQLDRAEHWKWRARLVELADKICNLRDVACSPPKEWSLERRREYFDWAKAVIDRLRGTHPELERLFDEAYRARP